MDINTQLQFAHNIKSLRLHKSMSQLEMAKKFNLSRTSCYSSFCTGRKTPYFFKLITPTI